MGGSFKNLLKWQMSKPRKPFLSALALALLILGMNRKTHMSALPALQSCNGYGYAFTSTIADNSLSLRNRSATDMSSGVVTLMLV